MHFDNAGTADWVPMRRASYPAIEAEGLAGLERHFPFAALAVAAVVAGEIASAVLMLIGQG
jgi:hypothetical protein